MCSYRLILFYNILSFIQEVVKRVISREISQIWRFLEVGHRDSKWGAKSRIYEAGQMEQLIRELYPWM